MTQSGMLFAYLIIQIWLKLKDSRKNLRQDLSAGRLFECKSGNNEGLVDR